MKQIETKRLILRRFRPEDAEPMSKLLFDTESMYKLSLSKPLENMSQVERTIQHWGKEEYRYAITLKEQKTIVGYAVIQKCGTRGELGLAVIPGYRGNGYVKETIKALITYLDSDNLEYLDACTLTENIAIQSLLKKVGFFFTGMRACPFKNSAQKLMCYSMKLK